MSANNQNIAGLSKRESTLNDGKSLSDSYGGEGDDGRSLSDQSDEEEESYSNMKKHHKDAVKYDDDK